MRLVLMLLAFFLFGLIISKPVHDRKLVPTTEGFMSVEDLK